jgi:hypothetical protein
VDLSSSSDEESLIRDTSWDAEFARRIFGDLNYDILRPHSDSNIIILNDSDEEEMHEEDATNADAAPSSVVGIPTSTTSAIDTDEALKGVQGHNSDDQATDREADGGSNGGDKAGSP